MAKQTQEEKRENELIKVRMDKMEALREKGVTILVKAVSFGRKN